MRNWERLIGRVSEWLHPGGTLFVHVFSHRDHCYAFEPRTERDWMARHFFTGGMMPSHGLPAQLDLPLELQQSFVVEGTHYARTADAWLEHLDARRDELRPLFEQTYGRRDAERWIERWRMFFMSCSELFGYRGGREWHVSHHLLRKPGSGERRI
jgi:cyclopropane-fatty-acyl-phospholipid synthase